MRLAAILFCVVATACGNDPALPPAAGNIPDPQPLTEVECSRLIKRELDNFPISGSPLGERRLAACKRGVGSYKRKYFDCVFASRNSRTGSGSLPDPMNKNRGQIALSPA